MGDAYKDFGRGTAAGDIIYKLYNNPSKPSTYDPQIAALLAEQRKKREKMEQQNKPKPQPKSRAHVNVPRQGTMRRYSTGELEDVPMMPRYMRYNRKQAAQIQQEMEEDAMVPVEAPDKKYISEKDKEVFQLKMQYNGEVPEPAPKRRPKTPPPAPPKLSTQELFDSIVSEVDDRRLFLEEMRKAGMAKKYDQRIKAEISARVAELKKLDRQLAEEAELLAKRNGD